MLHHHTEKVVQWVRKAQSTPYLRLVMLLSIVSTFVLLSVVGGHSGARTWLIGGVGTAKQVVVAVQQRDVEMEPIDVYHVQQHQQQQQQQQQQQSNNQQYNEHEANNQQQQPLQPLQPLQQTQDQHDQQDQQQHNYQTQQKQQRTKRSIQGDEDQEESEESFRVLLLLLILIVCFLSAFSLRQVGSVYLHETGASILIGFVVSGLVWIAGRMTHNPDKLKAVVSFDPQFFMIFLLPPIIFESGYNMNKVMFFKNFASIFAFAMIGTMVSTFVVGVGLTYIGPLMSSRLTNFDLTEMLVFGSLISATDPVTVLAIFKALHVDFNLYSNCFGESVLNDAVAIVLYKTLIKFSGKAITLGAIGKGVLSFAIIFGGSIICGVVVGLLSALLFKYTNMYQHATLEAAMLILYAYSSYLLAQGLELSGIVAILFCGIVMAHYTRKNISPSTKHLSIHLFEIFATMAETFVFAYLGLSIFSLVAEYDFGFIILAILLCLIGRAVNIFPLSLLVNLARGNMDRLPFSHQLMLWFGGLRGAIAFTLAIDYHHDAASDTSAVILTTTLVIVLLSVILLGGSTAKMLEFLKIKVGEQEEDVYFGRPGMFISLDNHILKPFFTRKYPIVEVKDDNGNTVVTTGTTPRYGKKQTNQANGSDSDGSNEIELREIKSTATTTTTTKDPISTYEIDVSEAAFEIGPDDLSTADGIEFQGDYDISVDPHHDQ